MFAVEINTVTKAFQSVTAVDQLSLSVPEGSVFGFIGPNGSGKSTTMRMIANIIYPDSRHNPGVRERTSGHAVERDRVSSRRARSVPENAACARCSNFMENYAAGAM